MRKIFAAMLVALMLSGGTVEAVPFTRAQLDRIFFDVEQVPANFPTLDLNAATLTEKFNGLVTPILQETMGTDDVSAMAHLFLIKDAKTFNKPDGDLFANIFGDYRVALIGWSESGGNFKRLNLCYTTPEAKDESLFTVWLLTAFIKSLAPDADPQALMNALTAENFSGSVVEGGVSFSIAEDGNLNVLTAVPAP